MTETKKPRQAKTETVPLVVDLDGTLIRSDLLLESFFALASSAPAQALDALGKLGMGRAAFKAELANHTMPDVATLPYNEPLLAQLRQEHAGGRRIYLASASNVRYVTAVAEHLGIFTGTFASNDTVNLKAKAKAEALVSTFGAKKFDYVGNEHADIPVWEQAANVYLTTDDADFQKHIEKKFPGAKTIPQEPATRDDYKRALRPHQWLKNLLIFVPMLAAHAFNFDNMLFCILAFASFSLIASSGYVLNDLLDLGNDRQHHTKRNRPFASGRINLHRGLQLLFATFGAAVAIGILLPGHFLLALLSYYALSLAYSTIIKRRMMLDVIVLSLLYGMRLIAGGAALAIPLSPWLLSFSTFFFLSLALVKRCSELIARQNLGAGDPAGRDYRLTDLPLLEAMAAASGYVAALTSGLYISGDSVSVLYTHGERLWAVPIILLYWVSRMLLLTHRGQMHDDPVLFAARDRISQLCGGAIFIVLLVSM